jgi:hypothetical protein
VAVQPVDITDNAGINIAAVYNSALNGGEFALAVRNMVSPANKAITIAQVSISSAYFQLSNGSPATERRSVRIKNGSAFNIFLGSDNTVTVSTGYLMLPGEVEIFDVGPAKKIFGIGPSGSSGVAYVLELG